MVEDIIEMGVLPEDKAPISKYDKLVSSLRGSIAKGMISYVDSDAFRLSVYLSEHPELYSPEELINKLEFLDALVKFGWKVPGWEVAFAKLMQPKLGINEMPLLDEPKIEI